MKKKLLTTAVLILCLSAISVAQVEKGNWFFGGSSSLEFMSGQEKVETGGTTSDGAKFTNFSFRPQVGYFVIDKLPVGLSLDFNMDKEKYTDPDSEYNWTSFMVGPFVRYYITDLQGFMPFGEAAMGIGSGNSKYTYMGSESEDKYGIFAFRVGAGVTYFVTENVGVDLFVGYANYQQKYEAEEEDARAEGDDVIYKNGGLDFKIGFVVSLGK